MGISITRSPLSSLSGLILTRPVPRHFRYSFPSFPSSNLRGCPNGHQWLEAARKLKYLKATNTIFDEIVSRQIQLPSQVEQSSDELQVSDDENGESWDLSSKFATSPNGSLPEPPETPSVAQTTDEFHLLDEMPESSVVEECKIDDAVKMDKKSKKSLKPGGEQGWAVEREKEINTKKILRVYDSVVVVDNVTKAREVVGMLTTKYRDLIHACDTEASTRESITFMFLSCLLF